MTTNPLIIKKMKRYRLRKLMVRLAFVAGVIVILAGPTLIYFLKHPLQIQAAPWSTSHTTWTMRKLLTLTNNSGSTINANTTYTVTIDTATLYQQRAIKANCDDVRIVYQPDNTTFTELKRAVTYAQGATNCSDSKATMISFPLQANITNGSSSTSYYLYYNNPNASAYAASDALAAYNVGAKTATFVAPFNGTTTAMAAGTGTPSTATGAIRYSGAKSALAFDGSNDYIDTGQTPTTLIGNGSTSFTIEGWVKIQAENTSSYYAYSKLIGGGATTNNGGCNGASGPIYLEYQNATTRYLNFSLSYQNTGSTCQQETSIGFGGAINLETWYYITATFDSTTKAMKTYINGVQQENATWGGSGTITWNTNLFVGGQSTSSNSHGIFDELRISNTVRYTANFTPPTSPLIRDSNTKLLYHFDENGNDPRNTGKTTDDSGNNYHGTLGAATSAGNDDPVYVTGLIGVNASTSETGNIPIQSFAGHQGVFMEEGTTNKITNPSFENSTYDTNWTASGGTATANTTAPFYKFGSTSYKIVLANSTDQTVTTSINAGNTNTHSLSAYVYRGTSSAIGGTVDATVAKLVYNGSAQTTTYTNMGGGWWRLSYSAAAGAGAQNYGVQILEDSGTLYIDGVQLEQLAYPTTYTDGSLGSNYSWSGTANNSTSTRTATTLNYSATSNISRSTGAVSFWYKNEKSSIDADSFGLFGLQDGSASTYIYGIAYSSCQWQFRFLNGSDVDSPITGGCDSQTGTQGKWQHVVFTWASGSQTFYINNSSFLTGTNTTGSSLTGSPLITIGAGYGANALRSFNGMIQDVRVYSTSLTSGEVADLYNAGLGAHAEGAETPKDKPSLYWKLDEGTGTAAQDESGNSNTGTITNAVYDRLTTSDRNINQFALKFDGTGDYVSKPYAFDTELDPGTDSFTLSSWFKHSSTAPASGTHMLVSRFSSGGYKIYMNTSGYMCFGIDSDSTWTPSHSACSGAAQGSYADSKWHHLDAVKDAVNNTITIYIDGVQVAQTAVTDTASLSGSSPTFYVGMDSDGSSNGWIGFIDDVKYFGVIHSAAQVKSDFLATGSVKGVSTSIGDQSTLASGLVGYWKMDEAANNTCSGGVNDSCDSSGNGNDLAFNGNATNGSGKFGNGDYFDGTTDYASVSDPGTSALDITNEITISAWIYPTRDTPTNGWSDLVVKGDTLGTDVNYWFEILDYAGTDYLGFFYNGSDVHEIRSTTTVPLNTWSHVVITKKDRTHELNFYINGIDAGTSDQVNNPTGAKNDTLKANNQPLRLGNTYSGQEFQGNMDEVRIYNRALSPAEVSQLYNWAPGPVGYWKMDDGSGQYAYDSSGNGNTGTLGTDASINSEDPIWSTGKFGQGIAFSQTDNDTIKTVSATTLGFASATKAFSIMLWVKTTGTSEYYLFDNCNTCGRDVSLRLDTGKVETLIDDGTNNNGTPQYGAASSYNDGKWHHIALTWNGAGLETVYADGVKLGTTTASSVTGSLETSGVFQIGRREGGGTIPGSIDDVRVYNYDRTGKQIVEDMNAGHPAGGSPLGSMLTYQKFDEGADNTCSGGTNDYCNSGNGGNTYDMANSGLVWTNNGKFGKAVTVDTNTDNASMGDVAFVDGLTGMTASLWLKPASLGTSKAILGKWTSGQTNFQITSDASTNTEIRVYISSNGGTDNGSNYCTTSGLGLSTSAFQQLTIVYDGTASTGNNIKVYRNASPITCTVTGTIPASMTSSTTSALKLGDFAVGSAALLSDYDNLKIFNYPLTVDEIKIDYNRNAGLVVGASSTASDGSTADNSSARAYCPPGNIEGNCAAGQNPAPVVEYTFDQRNSSTIYDSSGNNQNLTWSNARFAPGKYGSGAYFSGISQDRAYVADNSLTDFTTTMTLESWFKPAGDGAIIAKWSVPVQNGSYILYYEAGTLYYGLDSDGNVFNGSPTSCFPSAATGLQTNTWYHAALTYNAGTVNVYLNGVKVHTDTSSCPTSLFNSNGDFSIGNGQDNDPNLSFNGVIDQVVAFNYVRTPAQIAWDYNRGRPVAWYKFDECSGTAIHDASGNGVTGTQAGTTAGTCSTASTFWGGASGNSTTNTGKINNAGTFDGSNDRVTTSSFSPLATATTTTTKLSWGGWFYPTSFAARKTYMEKATEFRLDADTSGNAICDIYTGGGFTAYAPTAALTLNTWNHVICVYNGSNVLTYINGVLKNTSAAQTGTITAASSVLHIGQNSSSAQRFVGRIDDVRVYNYPLTLQQVLLLYNNDAAVRFAPLTGTP